MDRRIIERSDIIGTQLLLHQTIAFDKTNEHIFTFSASGNQVFKNRMVIRNNTTNVVVYDQTQTTMKLEHKLPINTLTNGICYNAELQVFDKDNIASSMSNKIIFYCYTTPTWVFSNVTPNQVIGNSSYIVNLAYTQTEGELLNSYQVYLYDSNKYELYKSGVKYSTTVLSNNLSGFEDNFQYFIRATGITVNGITLDTGYIPISVNYLQPSMFSLIELENNTKQCNIKIHGNIIPIDGNSYPTPALYIDNSFVDLSIADSWIKFDSGYNIEKNFTIQLSVRKLAKDKCIGILGDENKKIELYWREGKFDSDTVNKQYLWLKVTDGNSFYVCGSTPITIPPETEWVSLWIRRINNIYEVKAELKGV